ncbi:MAG: phosphatase PAP2 family protein [Aurantibacter sp.]
MKKSRLLFLGLLSLFWANDLQSQNKTLESIGDVFLFALPATSLGTTLAVGDKKGTKQFVKGLLLNQALTFGLKEAINKPRPFDNGNKAFPSGHTSTTFQAASFIQKRYGWKYGIPAYALASFTGYSRIETKRHDGWDVLAGALIGIGSTYIFTTPYQKEHFALTYSGGKNQHLIGFSYKF